MKKKSITQVYSWLVLSLCFLVLIVSIYVVLQRRSQSHTSIRQYSETLTDVGFDTFVTYTETTDEETFQTHLDYIKQQFSHYNELFDYYHTYDDLNNLKSINDAAGKNAVQVEKPLLECIQNAYSFYEHSDHFDVTQGSLLQVWHTYRDEGIKKNEIGENGSLPTDEELILAYNKDHWKAIEIDEKNCSIFIQDASVSIDLGGIAKGYTVQKIYEDLCDMGVSSAILNAGGNVMLIGEKNNQEPWLVGIQTPSTSEIESTNVAVVSLTGSHAVVTSGDYQRYYKVNDVFYSHIIDPTTLYPAHYMRSVTVIADNSTTADALSTTLFTMSYEEGSALLEQLESKGISAQAIWVFDDTCPSIPQDEQAIINGNYTILASNSLQNAIRK